MNRRHLLSFAALLACGAARAYDAESFVDASPGTMPVILCSPHDGTETVPGVDTRDEGVMVRDTNATLLAKRTADYVEKKTGRRPYIVAARFSRKSIDANRAPADAVESPEALPAYNAYHAQIAAFVAEVKAKWPQGAVLIDVHGQGREAGAVFRGTRNGLSVKSLLGKYGEEAISGENSLLGQFKAAGYNTYPSPGGREVRLDGGNTVVQYGSHHAGGIDTIQLEFGRRLRDEQAGAEAFGNAIIAFEKAYLPGPKQ